MKNCKFCDKDGTAWIYPLLQAVVTSAHPSELAALPPLPAHLGAGVADIALSARARYALRRVRPGYLYLLTERLGHRYWRSYQVLEDGFLYEFDAERPPLAPVAFTCERNACGVGASVIGIERVDSVEQAWLLFTPDPMTQARLDDYRKNAPAYAREGKLTVFDPRAWAAGRNGQPHTLAPAQLMTMVAEFILFRQHEQALTSPLGQAMKKLLFPAGSDAYAGTPALADGSELGFLGVLAQQLARHQAAVLVLADPIGITQELNDFRNEAIDGMRPWLQAVDAATGATNERKLHVLGALDEVGAALRAGAVSAQQEFSEQHRQSSDARLQSRLDGAHVLRQQGRAAEAQAIEQDVQRTRTVREANYRKALEDASAQGDQRWKKYARRLPGLEPLRSAYARLIAERDADLSSRVDDHLAWLQSAQLLGALHAYDRTHAGVGEAFQNQIGLAINGMNYTRAGAAVVMQWAQAQSVSTQNLLLRACCLNQQDIEQAVAQSIETARARAAEHSNWWDSLDAVQSAMKPASEAFDKTQSALEGLPPEHGYRGTLTGMGAAVYTCMGQALFKLGLDGQVSWIGQHYIGVLAATLGPLNSRVRLSELAHAGIEVMPNAARSQAQATRRVREAIAQEIAQGKMGDAYKIRAGAVIALIEAVGLLVRANKEDKRAREWLEVTSAALALGAAAFELLAVGTELVQKRHRSVTMTSRGAGVALGGIKLFAGTLAGVAGAVGAVYDFVDAGKAKNQRYFGLMSALYLRGVAQGSLAILGGVIGYSYCGPLFEFLARKFAQQAGLSGALSGLARGAYWLSRPAAGAAVTRVAILLRVAGGITWATAGLSVLVFFVADDQLEAWCDKSSFRPNPKPSDPSFDSEGSEVEKLFIAFDEVN